jgi:hypothetical protein
MVSNRSKHVGALFVLLAGVLILLALIQTLAASASPDDAGLFQGTDPTKPVRATDTPKKKPTATPTRPLRATDTLPPRATNTPFSASQPTTTFPDLAIITPSPTTMSFAIPSPTPIIDPYDHQFPLAIKTPTPTPGMLTGPPIPDLEITAIEVTQGLQSLYNDMPLAASRRTYVRVYVKTDGSDYGGIKGALLGIRNGQQLGIIYSSNQPITAHGDGGERINVDDSLYFALPYDWRDAGQLTIKAFVYSVVPSAPFNHEPDADNNFMDVDVEFQEAAPLKISMMPLHLHVNYSGAQPEKLYTLGEPDAWGIIMDMLRHIPAPTVQVYPPPVDVVYCYTNLFDTGVTLTDILFNQVEGEDFANHGSCNFNFSIAGGMEYATLMMDMIDTWTDDPTTDLVYYGMVHPDFDGQMTFFKNDGTTLNFTGIALNGQAYGIMDSDTWNTTTWYMPGGLTLAHEVGHRLGLGHANCAGNEEAGGGLDDDFPWTFPDCSIANVNEDGFYGFDVMYVMMPATDDPTVISNDPSASAPNQGFPMMGYQAPKWIDAFHYCKLLLSLGVQCDPFGPPMVVGLPDSGHRFSREEILADTQYAARRTAVGEAGFLVVTGVISRTDQQAFLVDIAHLEEEPSDFEDQHALDHEMTDYEIVLLDADGQVLAAEPVIDTTLSHEPGAFLSFLVGMPYAEGTDRIAVRLGDELLAQREVSENTPEVTVLTPNGGERFEGPFDIVWEASDPDGGPMAYTLQYSPDAGETWSALAINVTETHYRLGSLDTLAGSDQGMIRVLANDGVNVGKDTSDGTFSVPNTAPLPAILSPAHTKVFASGQAIEFSGSATDREQGVLSGDALSWSSDRDGLLGTGGTLVRRDLSPGRHVITLTATDEDGGSAQSVIAIAVDGEQHVDIPSESDLELLGAYLNGERPAPAASESGEVQEAAPAEQAAPLTQLILIAAGVLVVLILMYSAWRRSRGQG